MRIKSIVLCGVLTALMCVLCPIALPLNAVPVTLATLVIYLIASTSDVHTSLISVTIYIVLGCIGLPVFSGFNGGIGHILGPTGGFIVGYIPLTLYVSLFGRGKLMRAIGICIGTLMLYIIGCFGYCIYTNDNFVTAVSLCVLPFLPGDVIKIILTLLIYPKLKRIIKKN